MDATTIINYLMDYYQVGTITELALKMDSSQPTISKWRKNNSINGIKKKCRELGIYQDIFGGLANITNQTIKKNPGMAIGNVQGDNIGGGGGIENEIDDPVALALFVQAWKTAKQKGNAKELKIMLMDFCDDA